MTNEDKCCNCDGSGTVPWVAPCSHCYSAEFCIMSEELRDSLLRLAGFMVAHVESRSRPPKALVEILEKVRIAMYCDDQMRKDFEKNL